MNYLDDETATSSLLPYALGCWRWLAIHSPAKGFCWAGGTAWTRNPTPATLIPRRWSGFGQAG